MNSQSARRSLLTCDELVSFDSRRLGFRTILLNHNSELLIVLLWIHNSSLGSGSRYSMNSKANQNAVFILQVFSVLLAV